MTPSNTSGYHWTRDGPPLKRELVEIKSELHAKCSRIVEMIFRPCSEQSFLFCTENTTGFSDVLEAQTQGCRRYLSSRTVGIVDYRKLAAKIN